jgi:uncharacterized protein (DUF697 family)
VPRLPLKPTAVLGVVREMRAVAEDFAPLLVAGAPATAQRLVEALGAGAEPGAVRDLSAGEPVRYDLQGADVMVYAIEGEAPSETDVKVLRLADRLDVELVCVLVGGPPGQVDVPYVLATDVVSVAPEQELPLDTIAERIAGRAGDSSYKLAARVPTLRRPVCERIVRSFSRQNGILSVAVFIPGADFPVLTLNQIRMVLRIAAAHGEEIDGERAVELLPVVGAGLGFRALAHNLVGIVPGLGWAVQGAIAFTGTRALGEAAIAYFESGTPGKVKEYVRSRS